MTAERPCRCHSDRMLYGSLQRCPQCGHRSLDVIDTRYKGGTLYAGCERRKCGYEVNEGGKDEALPVAVEA